MAKKSLVLLKQHRHYYYFSLLDSLIRIILIFFLSISHVDFSFLSCNIFYIFLNIDVDSYYWSFKIHVYNFIKVASIVIMLSYLLFFC